MAEAGWGKLAGEVKRRFRHDGFCTDNENLCKKSAKKTTSQRFLPFYLPPNAWLFRSALCLGALKMQARCMLRRSIVIPLRDGLAHLEGENSVKSILGCGAGGLN